MNDKKQFAKRLRDSIKLESDGLEKENMTLDRHYKKIYKFDQKFQSRYEIKTLKPVTSELEENPRIDQKFKISKKKNSKFNIKSKSKVEIKNVTRKFFVGKGNNHLLVANILDLCSWQQATIMQQAHLIWLQQNRRLNYPQLSKARVFVNLFQNHQELTNKNFLYKNIREYCETSEAIDYKTILPTTFIIDFRKPLGVKAQLNEFLQYYIANHPKGKSLKLKGTFSIAQAGRQYKIKFKDLMNTIQWDDKLTQDDEKFVWILKPSDLNRGRGIKLFSKLKSLEDYLGQDEFESNYRMYSEPHDPGSYIIQRYIQNPLLINNRKFDIRMWAFIDQRKRLYLFRQGYLRLSGYTYSLGKDSLKNNLIHLTNNAVQKYGENYGNYEEGNQLSFKQFRQYLEKNAPHIIFDEILTEAKKMVKLCYNSTISKINPKNRKNTFQLFGFDFLVQSTGKLWLLQVNTNPCLQQSSQILRILLPKLLKQVMEISFGEHKIQMFEELSGGNS